MNVLEAILQWWDLLCLHASGLLTAGLPSCLRGHSFLDGAWLALATHSLLWRDASPLFREITLLGPIFRFSHGEERDSINVGQDPGFPLLHVDRSLGDGLVELLPGAVGHTDVAGEAVDLGRRLGRVSVPQQVVSISRGHGSQCPPLSRPALLGGGGGGKCFISCQLLRNFLGDNKRSRN